MKLLAWLIFFLSAVSTVKGMTKKITIAILKGDTHITARDLGIPYISFSLNTLENRFVKLILLLFIFLSTHLNVFGLCNLTDIFPIGRFH